MEAGRTALILGGSGRLGSEFARQLAARGVHLCLVARRFAPLQDLGQALQQTCGVRVEALAIDLAQPGAADDLYAETRLRGLTVDVLIHAAGRSLAGDFLDIDERQEERMLQLQVIEMTRCLRRYGRDMAEQGGGHILLVSSVAAFQATPGWASYAAAKSYVQSLGEALAYELRAQQIVLSVLAAGAMQQSRGLMPPKRTLFSVEEVVQQSLLSLDKGITVIVPGKRRADELARRLVSGRLMPAMAQLLAKSTVTRH